MCKSGRNNATNNNSSSISKFNLLCNKLKLGLKSIWILLSISFIFIIISPIYIYRWILTKICSIAGNYSHILSPQSHAFITGNNLSSSIWSNVIVRFKITGALNFEACKALFTTNIIYAKNEKNIRGNLLYPEFQQYLKKWGGFFFWKQEETFNIDEHIILYKNSNGGGSGGNKLSEIQAEQIEYEYLRQEFELNKSPWQILIVDNIIIDTNNEQSCFLILFKFHHALADGFALFNALMRASDEPILTLQNKSTSTSSTSSKLLQKMLLPFALSLELAKSSNHRKLNQPLTVWKHLVPDLSPSKSKQEIGIRSSLNVHVQQIKGIAVKHQVSFTAILLAGITGGLRNFLSTKYIDMEFPDFIMVALPVSKNDGKYPERLVNGMSFIHLKLPIGCPNITDRLQLIEENILEKKNSSEATLNYLFMNLAGYLPNALYAQLRRFNGGVPIPIALSLFPGPLKSVKFNGQEILEMSFTLLSMPYYLTIRILTYSNNQLQISCLGDHRLFSTEDMKSLCKCTQDEFLLLENLIGQHE